MKTLKLMTDMGVYGVGFKAPFATYESEHLVWALPDRDGTSGQVLKTDGAGNLGWVDAASGFYYHGKSSVSFQRNKLGDTLASKWWHYQ